MNETKQESGNSPSENPSIQEIVQRYLPEVEWMDEARGRAPCPGRHKHTSRSHKNDFWVFINGVPTCTCLHDSCREEVAKVNSEIRSAYNLFNPQLDETAMAAAKEKAAKRHALEAKAKASLPEILKQYRWDYNEIDQNYKGVSYNMFLERMWDPTDIIWCGEPTDSGHERNETNFRMAEDFYTDIVGHFTTASTYHPNVYRRSNESVKMTPYMILECDKVFGEVTTDEQRLANKNACGAITRWLMDSVGLKLRAVVDSGSKSLHSWFAMPSSDKFEELKIVLPMLGADRAMWKPSQPARLAGVMRENGKEQKLLYLK